MNANLLHTYDTCTLARKNLSLCARSARVKISVVWEEEKKYVRNMMSKVPYEYDGAWSNRCYRESSCCLCTFGVIWEGS